MKRIISLLLCLVLMTALAAPVSAASPEVIFTADSGFTPDRKSTRLNSSH